MHKQPNPQEKSLSTTASEPRPNAHNKKFERFEHLESTIAMTIVYVPFEFEHLLKLLKAGKADRAPGSPRVASRKSKDLPFNLDHRCRKDPTAIAPLPRPPNLMIECLVLSSPARPPGCPMMRPIK
jgi:hypothetical protein